MADKINDNEETEGSMIERMMRGEFDDIEISEEIPGGTSSDDTDDTDTAQEAVNNDKEDESQDDESADDDDNEDTEDIDSDSEDDESDSETNEEIDGDAQENDDDTDGTTEDEDSVTAPVESDSESDSETKDQSDDNDSENDEPNYKEEYEKLLSESKTYKDYYDTATSEFTANGVKVKGFTDPQKVIQAQQVMYGLEKKFSNLKKYRQFHAPLEKRGMITDQSKFDLAMNIMDGDVEAMKAHMKSLDIDPVDLDLDEVNYQGKTTTSSNIELGLNDIIDASTNAGIKPDVERVLFNEWDEDSVVDLLSTEASRSAFITHMKPDAEGNSLFKTVSQKAKEMSLLNSGFSDLNSIQKYNAALAEFEKENKSQAEQRGSTNAEENNSSTGVNDAIAEAKAAEAKKIADAEAKAIEKYRLELEQKNKAADEARKKAASLNTKKTVKKQVKKEADPMKLEGESFMDYWKQLERAGLK